MPVSPEVVQSWVLIAHRARIADRMLGDINDPSPDSDFAEVNAMYPAEKASDWHRSYITAALEHLIVWANVVAPLKFHPEHEVTHTFRPAYTLARAAMEASSQALWVTAAESARECARRHLSLIRWDYEEHRKSLAATDDKQRVTGMDTTLLQRASKVFTEKELRPPSQYTVLRAAAPAAGYDADYLERQWRAASGSAHGKVWPSLALQHVVPLTEYEPGQFRTMRVADTDGMTEVLEVAGQMTMEGVRRHAMFCKADVQALLAESTRWLASVIPLRNAADPKGDVAGAPDEHGGAPG